MGVTTALGSPDKLPAIIQEKENVVYIDPCFVGFSEDAFGFARKPVDNDQIEFILLTV